MEKTKKIIKPSSKTVIVYQKEEPEVYSNLKLFCDIKGVKYNTYRVNKFPFLFEGHMVHRVNLISGKIGTSTNLFIQKSRNEIRSFLKEMQVLSLFNVIVQEHLGETNIGRYNVYIHSKIDNIRFKDVLSSDNNVKIICDKFYEEYKTDLERYKNILALNKEGD